MRNLKKVLSLALALVMLLGMMVVGAGAATKFQDDASIQNKEAVSVLVGLGVMKGREDGSNFAPTATLTRAEAAMMIAQLDLGVEAAAALKANGTNTFTDVWTDHWAAGAIDYCVEQNYINGDGAGHFLPSRNVSGVQFASMLLRLLGYDAKIEGLVGDQWATKAAALARKAGLTTGVLANNDDMTRDGMAQMAFNALTASMVEYEGMDITIGDVAINARVKTRTHTGSTIAGVANTTYNGERIQANITPIRLCEERFPYLKLSTTSEDGFGHTASVWTYRNAEIAGSENTVAADIELTGKVEKTLPDWAKINGLTRATGAQLFINGDTSTTVPADAEAILPLTGNGRRVEIYLNKADMTKFDKIVITDTALAEVTKVVDSNETISVKLLPNKAVNIASDNTYSYTNNDVVAATNVVLNTKVGYGDVKQGDLVLVQGYSKSNPKLNEDTTVTSVEQATEVKGFATHKAYSSQVKATYIRIDGNDYYDALGVMKDFGTIDFNLNTNFDSTLYLDQYGYIMKAVQGEDPNLTTDSLIAVKEGYQTLTDGKIVNMVQGVLSNGQTVNWPLSSDSASASNNTNTIMRYEKLNNGTYKLAAISADRGSLTEAQVKDTKNTYVADLNGTGTVSFKSNDVYGQLNGRGYMYSDTVKFIFVDKTEGVTVVNGRQTYNFTRGTGKIVAQALKNGEITAVFVSDKADVANLEDVIFVSSRYRAWDEIITRENGQKVQYYGYTAYDAKGEAIDHFLGENENMANNFYVADKNADGAYKANHPSMLNNHSMVSGALQRANGLSGDAFVLKSGEINYEFVGPRGTVVKDLSDAKLYIASVSELNAAVNNGYNVTVAVLYNNTDSEAVTTGASKYVKSAVTVFVTSAKKSGGDTPNTSVDGNVEFTTRNINGIPYVTLTYTYPEYVDETTAGVDLAFEVYANNNLIAVADASVDITANGAKTRTVQWNGIGSAAFANAGDAITVKLTKNMPDSTKVRIVDQTGKVLSSAGAQGLGNVGIGGWGVYNLSTVTAQQVEFAYDYPTGTETADWTVTGTTTTPAPSGRNATLSPTPVSTGTHKSAGTGYVDIVLDMSGVSSFYSVDLSDALKTKFGTKVDFFKNDGTSATAQLVKDLDLNKDDDAKLELTTDADYTSIAADTETLVKLTAKVTVDTDYLNWNVTIVANGTTYTLKNANAGAGAEVSIPLAKNTNLVITSITVTPSVSPLAITGVAKVAPLTYRITFNNNIAAEDGAPLAKTTNITVTDGASGDYFGSVSSSGNTITVVTTQELVANDVITVVKNSIFNTNDPAYAIVSGAGNDTGEKLATDYIITLGAADAASPDGTVTGANLTYALSGS